MKISNSKKELARIISENGGWRDKAEWATQDNVVAFFSGGKPEYVSGDKVWCANGDDVMFIVAIDVGARINSFHNTILSRAEYFHLYPVPDADGWIEWNGGECPVDGDSVIDVKLSDGDEFFGVDTYWDWHQGSKCDIIAYRLHKPEQAKLEPVAEAKPSIESLAADYRNLKDYADRKQEEADAAKADYEAKLSELVAAGKALNLVISVADKEPELVITEWRDLQLGDIIEYVDGDIKDKIGMTGPVVEFAPYATDGMHVRLQCDNGLNKGRRGWPRKWRFIHRPVK